MEIVDYAMPMMKIEKYLRQVHDLCLLGQYGAAADICPLLISEARVLDASLSLMQIDKDKRDER